MQAAIRRYRVDSDSAAEVVRQMQEDLLPKIAGVQGFVGYYVLDAGDGTFATVTVFDSQAGVETAERLASEWVRQYLATWLLSQDGLPNFAVEVEETLQGTFYGEAPDSEAGQEGPPQAEKPRHGAVSKPSSVSEGSELLSVEDVSELLGMSKAWVYRKLRSGEIPSAKLGRAIRVRRTDLDEYLKSSLLR